MQSDVGDVGSLGEYRVQLWWGHVSWGQSGYPHHTVDGKVKGREVRRRGNRTKLSPGQRGLGAEIAVGSLEAEKWREGSVLEGRGAGS